MDANGWTRIEGEMAWARPFGLDYLLLYLRGEWVASHAGTIAAARTPRGAVQKVAAQSGPLPAGLSDDGTWKEPDATAPYTPKVGDWVERRSHPHPVYITSFDGTRAHYRHGEYAFGSFRVEGAECRPASQPYASWAIALDPKPGDTVTDRTGVEWERAIGGWRHDSAARGLITTHDDGSVFAPCEATRARIATIPDSILGLPRLSAASAVLDRRWDDVPDGVEVTMEWRDLVEVDGGIRIGAPPSVNIVVDADAVCDAYAGFRDIFGGVGSDEPNDEPDDRPVMAWCDDGTAARYRDPFSGTWEWPPCHPTELAKALNWRAVEVPRG